jgi:uncharacterized protein (UPF0332 family)
MVGELKPFDFNDCVRDGLLRNVPPSAEKAEGSIRVADRWLDESGKNLAAGAFNSSVLSSYLAMFHSARSILFFDGFREKSHYCISRYLEEKYARHRMLEARWVELLDHYRELRHESQYDISFFASRAEAESALKTAKEFTERMKALLKSRRGN